MPSKKWQRSKTTNRELIKPQTPGPPGVFSIPFLMISLNEICKSLHELAPLSYQESYDNSGLLCGDPTMEVRGVLFCLDCTEAVLEEALAEGCNLIVAHHPLVFTALKTFSKGSYVERILIKALKQDLAIYACHTNLDHVPQGVNARLAQKLGLSAFKILQPKAGLLKKLVTYVPESHVETLREALCSAGAGRIGNYDSCSFGSEGTGTFRGNAASNPFVGKAGNLHREKETRLEVLVETPFEQSILRALRNSHPYEEPAFDLYPLDNRHPGIGSGMIGELEQALTEEEFLLRVKQSLKAGVLRHTAKRARPIKRVAICGGSGRFLLEAAVLAGADAYVTADFKYHDFFDVDGRLLLVDPGHFETEQFTPEIFYEWFQNKFPKFALRLSKRQSNPIHYF